MPVTVAIALWWLSTVVILYRSGLPSESFGRTLAGATLFLGLGILLLWMSADDSSPLGAYMAFAGALCLFGWHEVSYLFGFVSGPRPAACPDGCDGWQRFVLGAKTCIYHELAVVATVAALAVATAGSANRVGLWTLVVLWLMRWSAKLNIFLGVRNLHVEFWPPHLAYLTSFTRERSMNPLFPVSIIVASTAVALLVVAAMNAAPSSADRTGAVLIATLLGLATLEHWFLILQLPDERLWRPGLQSRPRPVARPAPVDLGAGS